MFVLNRDYTHPHCKAMDEQNFAPKHHKMYLMAIYRYFICDTVKSTCDSSESLLGLSHLQNCNNCFPMHYSSKLTNDKGNEADFINAATDNFV